MTKIKILIIDDNEAFRNNLKIQFEKENNVPAITAAPDLETTQKKIDEDYSITDLLVDYLLPKYKAPEFIKKLNIEKNIRIWVVTGRHTGSGNIFVTNEKETILKIRKDNPEIKYIFLKPVAADEILWRIRQEAQENDFKVEDYPFLKNFPLPIRIIDLEEKSVVFHNTNKWTWDHLHPDPAIQHQEPKHIASEFSCNDFDGEKLIEKNYRLHSFELKENELRAEFCELLPQPNRDLEQLKIKIFKQMKEKDFFRGRFYILIKTENFDSKQPQRILKLCKIIPKPKITNKNPWEPLYGFLEKRISSCVKSEPKIRKTNDENKIDTGIQFWNKTVNTEGLNSFLELPIFIDGKVRGLMMFDRMGSKKIDDNNPSEVPKTVIDRQKVFFKRIIEDAEHFLKEDFVRNHNELIDKIDPHLQELMDTEPEEQALLQQVLDKAIEITKANGGYFVNSEGENSSLLEVRATSGTNQNLLQGASIPSDKKYSVVVKCYEEKKNIIIQNYQETPEYWLGNKKRHPNLEHTFQSLFNEKKSEDEITQLIKWVTEEINSVACFPLVYRGTVYGIFEIHSNEKYFFDEFKVNALTIYFQRIMGLIGIVKLHETKQNLLRGIAHEIRNDTAPIIQTLENIKSITKEEDLQKYYRRIENHTQNIRTLVENFFVLNSEQKLLNQKGFSIQLVCFQKYFALKSEDIVEDQIKIKFDQMSNKSDQVWKQTLQGDNESFSRVIRVLLDNAIYYASKEPQKKVGISVGQNSKFFEIVIENSGKLDDNNIFVAYYRGKSHGEGMHIGLAASKKTVTQLGGFLNISDTDNQRTVKTTLKWPLVLKGRNHD